MDKAVDENKEIPDLWPSVILLKWPLGLWKCCSVLWGEACMSLDPSEMHSPLREGEREREHNPDMGKDRLNNSGKPEQERKCEHAKLRYTFLLNMKNTS